MNEISLSYLLKLALRRLWILIVAGVVFGSATFAYLSIAVTPQYKAFGNIIVTNGAIITQEEENRNNSINVSGADISASLNIADTIVDLLKTPDIYKKLETELLETELNNRYSYSSLQGMASVAKRNEDTLFIDVSFTGTDPDDLITITNKFLDLTPSYVSEFIEGAKGKVATYAEGSAKIYPRTLFSTMIMTALGFAIAYVIVLIVDMLDHAIKSEDDFRSRFDLPILGTIPDFDIAGTSQKAKELYEYGNKK